MGGKQVAGAFVGTIVRVVVAAIILMLVYKYAVLAYEYGYRVFGETPVSEAPGREITVTIREDYSSKDIGLLLEQKGLIRDATLFAIQDKLSGLEGKIKSGDYTLSTAMTIEEMLEVMASKDDETEVLATSENAENSSKNTSETESLDSEAEEE